MVRSLDRWLNWLMHTPIRPPWLAAGFLLFVFLFGAVCFLDPDRGREHVPEWDKRCAAIGGVVVPWERSGERGVSTAAVYRCEVAGSTVYACTP